MTTTARAVARVYQGPRSMCACGHAGDGTGRGHAGEISLHAGALGHGSCVFKGCKCVKCTWSEYLPGFAATIDRQ